MTGRKEPWALRHATTIVVLGVALTVVAGLVAVFILPTIDRVVGNFRDGDLQRARADLRSSGLALATGIAAGTAGLLAWGRLELSRSEHRLAEQSQRNERFANAVALLGNDDPAVRTGALYALEGLARDGHDRQSVYDVICAFARGRLLPFQELEAIANDSGEPAVGEPLTIGSPSDRRSEDYEVAITVALRVPATWDVQLDLSGTAIVDRSLPDLRGVRFDRAELVRCTVPSTALSNVSLRQAQLRDCTLSEASLTECDFGDSVVESCRFLGARFERTQLATALVTLCHFEGCTTDPASTWPNDLLPAGVAAR